MGCSPRSSGCSGRRQCRRQPDSALRNTLGPRLEACTTEQPTPAGTGVGGASGDARQGIKLGPGICTHAHSSPQTAQTKSKQHEQAAKPTGEGEVHRLDQQLRVPTGLWLRQDARRLQAKAAKVDFDRVQAACRRVML